MSTTTPKFHKATRPVEDGGYPRASREDRATAPPKDVPQQVTTKLSSGPRVNVPSEKAGPVARWIAEKYRWAGELLKPADPICGATIIAAADNAGMAWQRAYKSSDFVKKLIDKLMESSVAGDLFFAHLPIFLAVGYHHSPGFHNYMTNSSLGFLVNLPKMEEENADV